MWAFIVRRLIYNIPVYLGIIFLVMIALRVNDPIYAYLPKQATEEDIKNLREKAGLDKPFPVQYALFLKQIVTLDFNNQSWAQPGRTVGDKLRNAIIPSLSLTLPALALTAMISICVGIVSSYFRGRPVDRILVIFAVLGMSISFLVYIILGQYFGAYWLNQELSESLDRDVKIFAISGYEQGITHWPFYCLLPVLISVIVAMGYDTRFYRAVMVEETGKDYITTARAKGAGKRKIMFVHMLRNAMIPIITRIMITLPFLITGSILLEMFFGIPGMGQTLITAINDKDFPVIQGFTAIFAAVFIVSNILTDVMYALVDPRVRVS